jgi:hypothetical protein
MLNSIRRLAWLPLAFIASILAGAAATWMTEFAGGSAWYVWLISGTVSGWMFFYVGLHVVPTTSAFVKWTSVIVVGTLGLMAALGPLMRGSEPVRAIAGAAMILVAVHYARLPVKKIGAEIGADSHEEKVA